MEEKQKRHTIPSGELICTTGFVTGEIKATTLKCYGKGEDVLTAENKEISLYEQVKFMVSLWITKNLSEDAHGVLNLGRACINAYEKLEINKLDKWQKSERVEELGRLLVPTILESCCYKTQKPNLPDSFVDVFGIGERVLVMKKENTFVEGIVMQAAYKNKQPFRYKVAFRVFQRWIDSGKVYKLQTQH